MTPRPIVVSYLTDDQRNHDTMLRVLVSIDGQRMTVEEALRLGLMVQGIDGGYVFDARRIREQAPYLVDMLSGKRRALPSRPDEQPVAGLQPRSR